MVLPEFPAVSKWNSMTVPNDLISTLRQRIRISPSASSVAASLPVIFFGDALSARVATVGLNPSKFEYLDHNGKALSGPDQRFASTTSLGVLSRKELSDVQADQAINVMRSYYDDGKPVYGSYFRHLKNFLIGMGLSNRGNPPAKPGDSQSLTDTGVVFELAK